MSEERRAKGEERRAKREERKGKEKREERREKREEKQREDRREKREERRKKRAEIRNQKEESHRIRRKKSEDTPRPLDSEFERTTTLERGHFADACESRGERRFQLPMTCRVFLS